MGREQSDNFTRIKISHHIPASLDIKFLHIVAGSSKLVVFSSLFPGEYEFTVVGNASDGDSAFLQRNFRIRKDTQ